MTDLSPKLRASLAALQKEREAIAAKTKEARTLIKECFREVDATAKGLSPLRQSYHAFVSLATEEGRKDSPAVQAELDACRNLLFKSSLAVTSGDGGLWVRMWLGAVDVKVYRDRERLRLKLEYEKFKGRTNYMFIFLAALCLVLPTARWVHMLFQFWLCYYFITLALRENILKVNGSNINAWWIWHHYFSLIMSVTIVTWPASSSSYTFFMRQFCLFCVCQGSVQILLHKYQQARLYRAKALGQANRMDVPGDMASMQQTWSPSMSFILPFILFLHCFQLYNSVTALYFAWKVAGLEYVYNLLGVGILFAVLGIGNLTTTVLTYRRKGWGAAAVSAKAKGKGKAK